MVESEAITCHRDVLLPIAACKPAKGMMQRLCLGMSAKGDVSAMIVQVPASAAYLRQCRVQSYLLSALWNAPVKMKRWWDGWSEQLPLCRLCGSV